MFYRLRRLRRPLVIAAAPSRRRPIDAAVLLPIVMLVHSAFSWSAKASSSATARGCCASTPAPPWSGRCAATRRCSCARSMHRGPSGSWRTCSAARACSRSAATSRSGTRAGPEIVLRAVDHGCGTPLQSRLVLRRRPTAAADRAQDRARWLATRGFRRIVIRAGRARSPPRAFPGQRHRCESSCIHRSSVRGEGGDLS